ncbi:MAG: hypothetical protein EBY08_03600 [Actinobacteria bacterium]|nr:hypothetical protein [Actinomycetota bacterium]NDA96955.1 hypothetical protein [Actinomycetota bacterium]NDD00029.1 hypothetical protein [bacterium]
MPSLLDLFRAADVTWNAANRAQLSDAVKQLADDKGGIRALSRFLQVPLTSLNRGIATDFATTRASTIDRLAGAVREQGVSFTTQRQYSVAVDYTSYKTGDLASRGPMMLGAGREASAIRFIYENEDYLATGGLASSELIALDGVDAETYIQGSGIGLDRIVRVIYL